jgi:hypothetical protein
MESWRTEEAVDSLEVQLKNRRTVLLTVVCILTWAACGIPFTMTTYGLIGSTLAKGVFNPNDYTGFWFFLDWLILPALCTIGAIFMFRLKRWGFWIYCLGKVPEVLFSIYTIMGLTKSLGPGLFWGLLWNAISIAFIVVYASEMNKLSGKPISTDF